MCFEIIIKKIVLEKVAIYTNKYENMKNINIFRI